MRPSNQPEEQALKHPSNEPGEGEGIAPTASGASTEQETDSLWYILLEEFHKTQCLFVATLMIASLTLHIYGHDMLQNFLLMPISLNGILPVAFTYFLLVSHNSNIRSPSGFGLAALTVIVHALSSVVYWSLYAQFLPFSSNTSTPGIFSAVSSSLSAIPACGHYSAFALCPKIPAYQASLGDIEGAGDKLLVLTPVIWAFSTVVLLALLASQFRYYYYHWRRRRLHHEHQHDEEDFKSAAAVFRPPWVGRQTTEAAASHASKRIRGSIISLTFSEVAYIVATMAFLAGMGMQLSLLSVPWTLELVDPDGWSFGQVVAVTIWVPPLVELLYEFEQKRRRRRERRAKRIASSELTTA